jgi:IS1 family transposase
MKKAQTVLDSINVLASKQWLTDSLAIYAWADSLKRGIEVSTTSKVEQLNNKVDSLTRLQLPTSLYTKKIDSILSLGTKKH